MLEWVEKRLAAGDHWADVSERDGRYYWRLYDRDQATGIETTVEESAMQFDDGEQAWENLYQHSLRCGFQYIANLPTA